MAAPDMDVIREIPGYKVILKAIIKSQIQQLVEQLASNTDEESVILTASVTDGTLSHMGSDSAKGFLEDHEDIKSQFLGFCLKSHHERQEAEKEAIRQKELAAKAAALRPSPMDMMGPGPRRMRMPYHLGPRGQHYSPTGYVSRPPGVRHEPYPIQRPMRRPSAASSEMPSQISQNSQLDDSANFPPIVKSEPMDNSATGANISDNVNKDDDNTNSSNPNETEDKSGDDSSQVDPLAVKIESISESEFELEITGVEPGVTTPSMAPDNSNWGQNVSSTMGYDPSMGAMGSAADMSMASSQGYKINNFPFPEMLSTSVLGQLTSQNAIFTQNAIFSQNAKFSQNATFTQNASFSQNSTFSKNSTFSQDATFSQNASSYMSQQNSGTPLAMHACKVCGKEFHSKGRLGQHEIIHSGQKPFDCKTCGKCFNNKGNLRRHMITHLNLDTQHLS